MKYLKDFNQISMTNLPVKKYPINYKCTHIYEISDTLKSKYGLDIHNLQPGVETPNEYHDFNLYDFIDKKIQKENTIYPNLRLIDIAERKYQFEELTDNGSVILLPISYDSSKDEKIHKEKTQKNRNKLISMFKSMYKNKELDDALNNMDKHVDFGRGNFKWANIALEKIYEEYKQYYNNGYLRVWFPFDNDSDANFNENPNEDVKHGYPIKKMLFLSEIEKFLETNYNLSDDLFYEFVEKNNYIEGRYWEKPLCIDIEESGKLIRKGGKYGMDATSTIDKMLSILEMEYKNLIQENIKNKIEKLEIYIDYYKKTSPKY